MGREVGIDTLKMPSTALELGDFVADGSYEADTKDVGVGEQIHDLIDGVSCLPFKPQGDSRGSLTVFYSVGRTRRDAVPHVYQVYAEPGSIRGWVYHRVQTDRLAFTQGDFQIVLYDIRPGSPTAGRLNIVSAGSTWPVRLEIPPFVIHCVRNRGSSGAHFLNMPSEVFDRDAPDKLRLPYPDSRIPFAFD